jgi:hypothetical protein
MRLISQSLKKMQRAGGKVSKNFGYSESTHLALLKKKQDLEMAKMKHRGGQG